MKNNTWAKLITFLLLVLFTGFFLSGCSSGGGSSPSGGGQSPTPTPSQSTTFSVGAAGGNIVTQSGKVSLTFPANAVDENTTFTVTPNKSLPADAQLASDTSYDFSPSKTFAQPVQLKISYGASSLGNIQESSLKLYKYDSGNWTQVADSTVNTSSKTVMGTINSFSTYGIRGIVISPTPTPVGPQGTITGSVRDAVSNSPVENVAITVRQGGTTVTSGATLADGSYSILVPAGSGYQLVFSKTNYMSADYSNISVSANETAYLETVLQIDSSHAGTGNMDGVIKNALDGTGVSGLDVDLRSGFNSQTGTIVASTSTQNGGSYSFSDITAGNYTAELSGNGYVTTYVTLLCIGGTTTTKDATISPSLPSGQTRIVLTWGSTPADLDLHLTGPATEGSRFHVYWNNKSYLSYVNLDLDDTSSFGPETITISTQENGMYRCSIHDFTNRSLTSSTALANSGAQVKVYRGSNLVATYNVPSQAGTLWTVFELNGDTLTPVNTMSYESDYTNIKGRCAGRTDAKLMRNMPAKK